MRLFSITILALLTAGPEAKAQFFFKDIISSKDATKTFNTYRQNKVNRVAVSMLDNYGEPSNDFRLEKKIDKKFLKTELITRTQQSSSAYMYTLHDATGKTLMSTDSSDISVVKTKYSYTTEGEVASINTNIISRDEDFVTEINELHQYEYNDAGELVKMYKIMNAKDTTIIQFAYDESGNLSLEKNTINGTKFYYYYDENRRLTDIVQASLGRSGLHPDYIFSYNRQGELLQMITTGEANGEYVTWKYTYENGLRSTEKLYGKDKKLIGTMEYLYK